MVIESNIYDAALTLWGYHNVNQPIMPCDLIVGLGSYDVRVAHRVAELYQQKIADRIVLTGGLGNWTKKIFNRPEAVIFNEILVDRGIPLEVVRLECAASNIGENISLTKAMVEAEPIRRILLVTKPHTKRRAYVTALKQWPEVEAIVSSPQTFMNEQPTETHTIDDLINEMVGDLARIKSYPALGYQIEQEIPLEVERAFQLLCQSGYTAHLPAG